jgi:hypothetical protein
MEIYTFTDYMKLYGLIKILCHLLLYLLVHTWLRAILFFKFYAFITLSIPKYTKQNIMICIMNSPFVVVGAAVTILMVAAVVGAIVARLAGVTVAKRKKQTISSKIA